MFWSGADTLRAGEAGFMFFRAQDTLYFDSTLKNWLRL
jgi:hypothetical protein